MVASVDLENCIRPKHSLDKSGVLFRVSPLTSGEAQRVRSRALGLREGASLGATRFMKREQLTVKIVRAHGGCLGTRRRRRTWTAAISHGEALNSL